MLWDKGGNDGPNICSSGKGDIKKESLGSKIKIPLHTEAMSELRLMLGEFWVQREIYRKKKNMPTNMQSEMEIKV